MKSLVTGDLSTLGPFGRTANSQHALFQIRAAFETIEAHLIYQPDLSEVTKLIDDLTKKIRHAEQQQRS